MHSSRARKLDFEISPLVHYAGKGLISTAQPAVDFADLFNPLVPLAMLQEHDVFERPVEMVSDVRYLLVQCVRGVAGYSPTIAVSCS